MLRRSWPASSISAASSGVDAWCLEGTSAAAGQVEAGALRQHVQHHAAGQQRRGALGLVGVGDDPRRVEDRDRAAADDAQHVVAVDSSTTAAVSSSTPIPSSCGRLGHDHQQPAVAVALVEVLVDHGRLEQPEAGRDLGHPLLGRRARRRRRRPCGWTGCWRRPRCRRRRRRGRGPRRCASPPACRPEIADSLSWLPPVMKMPVALLQAGHQLGVARRRAARAAGRQRPRRHPAARNSASYTSTISAPRLTRRSGSPRSGPRHHRSPRRSSFRMRALAELVLGTADDHEGSPGHDREASGCHSGPVQRQPRHLVLVRHAKAENAGPSDRERELTPAGHDAAAAAGPLAGRAGRAARTRRWSPRPPGPEQTWADAGRRPPAGRWSRRSTRGCTPPGPTPRSTWCAASPTT